MLETPGSPELPEVQAEAAVLVDLLTQRHRALVANLEGGFPELRSTVWQSDSTVQVRGAAGAWGLVLGAQGAAGLLLRLCACLAPRANARRAPVPWPGAQLPPLCRPSASPTPPAHAARLPARPRSLPCRR